MSQTNTAEAELADLLEKLIAAPVKGELTDHLHEVEDRFREQRKTFAAQISDIRDVTTTEAKRLRGQMEGVGALVEQHGGQGAADAATARDQAARHAEALQARLSDVLGGIAALTAEQRVVRDELRSAREAVAAERRAQAAEDSAARRVQFRNLALLAPGAGLLGAGAVELLHLFV
ncbi:hypothetical protein PK98_15385 [Croceibacterium mercuriale]|uniref:Uncharacterized protein n=1 Tax=Croceibacterium mercuriale TaxID=1572751 RepID=A0A0B2BWF7_9SPHN|nr:hypothetical protein [Croceibacterium mercuriale]KHL24152.1 hypothetical protein PK98_15385 [Croceibacterium mercuriale]